MARNPALETKVKALKGKLLTNRDYINLINCANLSEVIKYLKENTHFSQYLESVYENESRTILEESFNHIVINNSNKILYFVHGSESDFIKLVIQKINLTSFLVIIHALAKKENLREIIQHLAISDQYSEETFESLIDSYSWDDFKKKLRKSIYYRALETYPELTPSNLFDIEKTMERSYYDLVYQYIKNLNNKTNEKLIECIRTEIDLNNLMWIYRTKKFYHYNVDQIIPYVYRGGLRVSEKELYRLAEIDDYDELLIELKKFKEYNFLFDHPEENLDLHMNRRKKRFMYYQFKELFFFGDGISSAYAYLQLLDSEISDIISIIEAKRYSLSAEETINYLIRNIE